MLLGTVLRLRYPTPQARRSHWRLRRIEPVLLRRSQVTVLIAALASKPFAYSIELRLVRRSNRHDGTEQEMSKTRTCRRGRTDTGNLPAAEFRSWASAQAPNLDSKQTICSVLSGRSAIVYSSLEFHHSVRSAKRSIFLSQNNTQSRPCTKLDTLAQPQTHQRT